MRLFKSAIIAAGFLTASAGAANAAIFSFSATVDSTATISEDSGFDPIVGTMLTPGDSFTLDIHADGDDFWRVNANSNNILAAILRILESGARFSDITTTLFLDGVQVAQEIQLNVEQANVHMGNQTFNFLAGVEFDQLVVSLDFLSTAAISTTTNGFLVFDDFAFWLDSDIEYIEGVSDIPLPMAFWMMGAGLAGIGAVSRKRKKVTA